MGEQTGISWATGTWSPWTGCAKVSPACDGCYAAHLMDTRMHRVEWGEPGVGEGTRDLMSDAYWQKPLQWDREAAKTGVRPWVFPSLCDPFDLAVEPHWHARFHNLILSTPNVFWLLLTKRIGNVRKVADHGAGRLWSATNWAAGATFANQTEWVRDGWKLRDVGRAFDVKTFGSFEPLLSDIRFDEAVHDNGWIPDWVITGGETDQGQHKARPSHPDWFRSIRDQCAAAGVPYHHKQNGEWMPICFMADGESDDLYHPPPRRDREAIRRCKVEHTVMNGDGSLHPSAADPDTYHAHHRSMLIFKVGKKHAGRLLDGVQHDAMPEGRV